MPNDTNRTAATIAKLDEQWKRVDSLRSRRALTPDQGEQLGWLLGCTEQAREFWLDEADMSDAALELLAAARDRMDAMDRALAAFAEQVCDDAEVAADKAEEPGRLRRMVG